MNTSINNFHFSTCDNSISISPFVKRGGDHWKQMYINYYYYPRCIRKRELSTFGAKRNHGTLGLALMHFPLSNLAFGPDALESDYTPYSPHLLGLRLHHDSLQHGLLSSSPFSRQVSSSARLAQQTRLTLGDECWTYDLLLSPNTPIFVIIKFAHLHSVAPPFELAIKLFYTSIYLFYHPAQM